jgi:predicted site-specific integrase-resolvase
MADTMLTPKELATRLNVSVGTARAYMRKEPGVIRLTRGSRTQYRMTEKAYKAFLARHSKPAL